MEAKIDISSKQIVSLVALFLIGTTLLLPPGQEVGHHGYFALSISYLGFLVIFSLYYLLNRLAPGKNLFSINTIAFGKWLGVIVNLFYATYFFILTALIIANFVSFINSVILVQTPKALLTVFLVFTTAYAVNKGFESIARASEILVVIVVIIAITITLLLIEKFDFSNFLPLWPSNWGAIFKSSFNVLVFPFGETIVLLAVFYQFDKTKKVFPSYFWGSLLAFVVLLQVVVRNTAVLGEFCKYSSYPAYDAARLANVAQIISRVEVLISINYMFAGYIKVTSTYYVLCRALKEIFSLPSYKRLVFPLGALISLTVISHQSTIVQNLFFVIEIYPYYAIIPQFFIMLIAAVLLLLKRKRVAL